MKKNNTSSDAIIWQGFWYKWKKVPHRLSYLGSRFNNFTSDNESCSAHHDMTLKIGNFPKGVANYKATYTAVRAEGVFIGQGSSEEIRLETALQKPGTQTLKINVKPEKLRSTFDSSVLSESSHPKIKILFNGFSIKPVGNESGWHFGGLGISFSEATWNNGTIEFTVEVYMRPAIAPEPIRHGNKNNGVKWHLEDPYIYLIEVGYTVFIAEKDDLSWEKIPVQSSANRTCKIGKKQMTAVVAPNSLMGIEGFRFDLRPHKSGAKRTGRYIRSMGLMLTEEKNGVGISLNFSNTIFKNREFTAAPWNMKAKIDSSLLTFNKPILQSKGVVEGQTSKSGGYTFSKRVFASLSKTPSLIA